LVQGQHPEPPLRLLGILIIFVSDYPAIAQGGETGGSGGGPAGGLARPFFPLRSLPPLPLAGDRATAAALARPPSVASACPPLCRCSLAATPGTGGGFPSHSLGRPLPLFSDLAPPQPPLSLHWSPLARMACLFLVLSRTARKVLWSIVSTSCS